MQLMYLQAALSSKMHLWTHPAEFRFGVFFTSLLLVLRFQVGEKGTENPGSEGLPELTSLLFINVKLKFQWVRCKICAALCIFDWS